MGHSASVSDDVEARVVGLEVFVEAHFHVVEFNFHAVEQGIVVGCSRSDLVEGIDHLYDAVEDAFGQDQAQVAGSCLEGGAHSALLDAGDVAPASAGQVAEALYNDSSAQHIGEAGDALTIAVAVLEGLGKMFGDQEGKVGVFCLPGRVFKAVAVYRDDAVGIFIDHDPVGVHAEGAHAVLEFLGPVYDLALIQFVRQVGKDH